MTRQTYLNVAIIAGLFLAGGLCGIAARLWIGGLKAQHAQLERCVLASKHADPDRDARATLARLTGAGYEEARNNDGCEPAMWQGNVFCYMPKSSLGRLLYRIETKTPLSLREGR